MGVIAQGKCRLLSEANQREQWGMLTGSDFHLLRFYLRRSFRYFCSQHNGFLHLHVHQESGNERRDEVIPENQLPGCWDIKMTSWGKTWLIIDNAAYWSTENSLNITIITDRNNTDNILQCEIIHPQKGEICSACNKNRKSLLIGLRTCFMFSLYLLIIS